MQLNEIIEENTPASISSRTRLSLENLERLFKRDFSHFRKVQALGFISILEREYHADLSQLRAECLAYFEEQGSSEHESLAGNPHHNPPHKPPSILDMSMDTRRRRRSVIKPILVVVVGGALLYAAWHTYTSNKGNAVATSASGTSAGFFSSIVQHVQSWMGSTSNPDAAGNIPLTENQAGEGNRSGDSFVIADKSDAGHSAGTASAASTKPAETAAQEPSVPYEKNSTREHSEAEKVSEGESDTSETVQGRDGAAGSTGALENTTDAEIQQIGDALAAATDAVSAVGTNTSDMLATEVPSVSQDTQEDTERRSIIKEATERALRDAREVKTREEEAARKKAAEEEARRKAEEEARRIAAEEKARQEQAERERAAQELAALEKAMKAGIVLQPRSKVWLGVVDLTTMKRTATVTNKKMTFKKPNGKWIVAAGHGRITFKIGDKTMKLNDGKKHFLLIERGTVKEISHKKFQKLNKSKVW